MMVCTWAVPEGCWYLCSLCQLCSFLKNQVVLHVSEPTEDNLDLPLITGKALFGPFLTISLQAFADR